MVYRRPVRLGCGALATGLSLVDCSGASGGATTEPAGSKSATTDSGTRSSPTPTLEEALRCPDQQLRQGERITELASQGSDFGNLAAEAEVNAALLQGAGAMLSRAESELETTQ